jgi:hypothetical protein
MGASEGWAVVRDDRGPFPVFTATRGSGPLPPRDELRAATEATVTDLLAGAGTADPDGWTARNLAGALVIASLDVVAWEGVEWAVESDPRDGEPTDWAGPGDVRTPYAWLRARGDQGEAVVEPYQDEAVYGLNFVTVWDRPLPESAAGSWRPRRAIALVTGPIHRVDVAYDTTVAGGLDPGLLTEAVLHGSTAVTHLIAADAYSREEWHLHADAVTALTDPEAADTVEWIPDREPRRPTATRPRRA